MKSEPKQSPKTFIVRLSKQGIYLNPDLLLGFDQTNIPHPATSFNPDIPCFWELKQKSYDQNTNLLLVEVVDYTTNKIEQFKAQNPKRKVDILHFEFIDWVEFEKQLFTYRKAELKCFPIFRGLDAPLEKEVSKSRTGNSTIWTSESEGNQSQPDTPDAQSHRIALKFSKKMDDLDFVLGGVQFKKRIPQLNKSLSFEIENSHILPEFNYIKPWFSKALKTPKIAIEISILVSIDNQIVHQAATSKDIDRIDEDFISTVKFQRSLGFTKKPLLNAPDKSLFGAEDFFDGNKEDPSAGNVFGQSPEDLMNDLLNAKDVRNKRNIQYLARLQSPSLPLKFTQHPDFGFLFFIEGQSQHHFAWELLDSHATYLWSFEKETSTIPQQYARIEAILSKLRIMKREPYKRAFKEGLVDSDLVFFALHHSHKNSGLVDSFPRWRHALMEKLV